MAAILQHFEIPLNSEGTVKGKCKHCSQVISGHTKTTSNFVKHMKVNMKFMYYDLEIN